MIEQTVINAMVFVKETIIFETSAIFRPLGCNDSVTSSKFTRSLQSLLSFLFSLNKGVRPRVRVGITNVS